MSANKTARWSARVLQSSNNAAVNSINPSIHDHITPSFRYSIISLFTPR
jgi:hypothetical protein